MSLPTCPTCVYAKGICKKTGVEIRTTTGCSYHTPKPITNADRIRGKCETDEGLYAFILGVHSLTTDRYGDPDYRLVVEGEEFRDDESLLSWLKATMEEGEG